MTTERFFDLLYGTRKGHVELRFPEYDERTGMTRVFWSWPEHRDDLLAEVKLWTGAADVFAGVLLRSEAGKGDAAHCEDQTEWLWADVDKKKGSTFSTILRAISHTPEIVVDSGHGWHLYWHLAHPVPVGIATEAMKVLAARLGGDAVGDPARIMRVPGTINMKGDDRIPVRLLRLDPITRHPFSDFDLPKASVREPRGYTAGELWELSGDDAPRFGEGMRNHELTKLAGAMIAKGMTQEEMMDALLAENDLRCDPPLMEREVAAIVRSVMRYRDA